MQIREILEKLRINRGKFPREALQQAISCRNEIIPELLKIIEYTKQNIQTLNEDGNYFAHIYAMFLLAQFKEKKVYPLIVSFFSIPGEITLEITGDFVTEDLNRVLASVSHGDLDPIKSLIENENVNEYVRGAALQSLLVLMAQKQLTRDDLVRYCKSLFQGKIVRKFSLIWSDLVVVSTDLYPEELYEDIKQAYEDNLVDPGYMRFNEVKWDLDLGKKAVLERLNNDIRYTFIGDVISEIEWWACFKEPLEPKEPKKEFPNNEYLQTQPIKTPSKIGRNQPCSCGSGKKYKKCCGRI